MDLYNKKNKTFSIVFKRFMKLLILKVKDLLISEIQKYVLRSIIITLSGHWKHHKNNNAE